MDILLICVFVHHVHAWCLWRSEEGVRFLKLKLEALSHHVGARTQNQVLCMNKKML